MAEPVKFTRAVILRDCLRARRRIADLRLRGSFHNWKAPLRAAQWALVDLRLSRLQLPPSGLRAAAWEQNHG